MIRSKSNRPNLHPFTFWNNSKRRTPLRTQSSIAITMKFSMILAFAGLVATAAIPSYAGWWYRKYSAIGNANEHSRIWRSRCLPSPGRSILGWRQLNGELYELADCGRGFGALSLTCMHEIGSLEDNVAWIGNRKSVYRWRLRPKAVRPASD